MSMTDGELDEILTLRWPHVMRRVLSEGCDDWIKGFVRSIARQGKRRNWRPSSKQEAIMRQLLAEHGKDAGQLFDLIER